MATLHFLPVLLLPPRRRAVFGFDKALAEDMVKNILQVRELVVLELEFDELCGRRSLEKGARGELVGQPKLSVGHDG